MGNFNLRDGIKAVFAAGTPLQLRLHWILRISAGLCFIGHGAWGIITKSGWLPFYDVFNVPHNLAWMSMPLVGTMDIVLGVLLLMRPIPAIMLYMAAWAVMTATLRPLAGQGWWEFLERGGNYGAPLALLYLCGTPRAVRDWFVEAKEPALTKVRMATLTWHLRVYTAMLMIGHGGYGAFHQKEMLINHFRAIGFKFQLLSPQFFIATFGWIEILLGLAILLKPTRKLALFLVFWKLITEFLYVIHGPFFWEVFEFIERWGSYGCPLALYYLLAKKDSLKPADTSLNEEFNHVIIFLCIFVVGLVVVPKNLIFKPQAAQYTGTLSDPGQPRLKANGKPAAPGEIELPNFPIRELSSGGYVVFMRHTPRNIEADKEAGQKRNIHDRNSTCSEATRLNADGVAYARQIGELIKAMDLPLGEVITSPSCRTQQMVKLMFPNENYFTMKEILYIYAREPGADHAHYNLGITEVLTKPLEHGQNRYILAHKNVIRHDTIGFMIDLDEGDSAVFKPTGQFGQFNPVGKIPIQAWLDLYKRTEK